MTGFLILQSQANRPDCQCIYGMAREVAAVLGKELKEPATDYTADDVKKENFKVSVLAQDICLATQLTMCMM